jgi:undecaprenyl diphosphate synthase
MNYDKVPKHVAIIMDGNGRWAKKQGFIRTLGHEKGSKTVITIIEEASNLGIKFLTLYTFSTENWSRPKYEIDKLMNLLVNTLRKEIPSMIKNNIKFNTIGDIERLPEKAKRQLHEVLNITKDHTGMTLTLALSYSSRLEWVDTCKSIAEKVKNNLISVNEIDESLINKHLYTHDMPDVDLLIRTSGEHRISNFMLWQIAYAELYFCEVLWPDFKPEHLHQALESYQNRERRFGKTSEQIN